MTAAGATGRIDALFRYPVKSMQGEAIDATAIGERGVVGDRAYALVDEETGKVASAKNPRRWGVLFECHARFVDEPDFGSGLPPVEVTAPDGDTVRSDDPDVHEWLSRVVGRPVRLETEPPERAIIEQYHPTIEGLADAEGDAETTTDDVLALVA